jgi:hypothetical protein
MPNSKLSTERASRSLRQETGTRVTLTNRETETPVDQEIFYVVCSVNSNGKCPSTQFFENNEIVFHLALMSQCEERGESHLWDSAHAD